MTAALDECNQVAAPAKPNFAAISRKYGLQRTTLSRRWHKARQGPSPTQDRQQHEFLEEGQRAALIQRLRELSSRHLYVTPAILRNMATEIGSRRPGRSWAQRFIRKYKSEFKCITVSGMETARHVAEYRPVFEEYFDIVCQILHGAHHKLIHSLNF